MPWCCMKDVFPTLKVFGEPCDEREALSCKAPGLPSFGGKGLFLRSLTAVEEETGVP